MAPEPIFAELPADPDLKFVLLEQYEREKYERACEGVENDYGIRSVRFEYMNSVLAYAEALGIDVLAVYPLMSTDSKDFHRNFEAFYAHAKRVSLHIRLAKPTPEREYSVALDPETRAAIQRFVEEIKGLIDKSRLVEEKRNSLLHHLNLFAADVDRSRTRFDIAMRTAIAVKNAVRDSADEFEPAHVKLAKRIWSRIEEMLGDAKTREEDKALPPPVERVKLPPPPKMIEGPKKAAQTPKELFELDDEIPF